MCGTGKRRFPTNTGWITARVVPTCWKRAALRALGVAGAAYIQRSIDMNPRGVIGIGHGRTPPPPCAMSNCDAPDIRFFVSLLGGLTRNYAANPMT